MTTVARIPAQVTATPVSASNPATSRKPGRIAALDFTKGALVLIMVLYHWLNYFYRSPADVYRYLRFLTPSFIMITGFLISSVYLSKYGVTNPQLPGRLFERGLKILAVFFGLNILRALLLPGAARAQLIESHSSLSSLGRIYFLGADLGAGDGKSVAFFILVPIGYLLILSAALLPGARRFRYVFHAAFLAALAGVFVLDHYRIPSTNLQLLTIGLLGVLLGYFPMEKIDRFVAHPFWVCVAYALYVAAITRWNVLFSLQLVGVCLSLIILYLIGKAAGSMGVLGRLIVFLGLYSLVGYIAQIAILQGLYVAFRHSELDTHSVQTLTFIAAVVLTILAVGLTDWTRKHNATADRLYKAVFA
jgi:peptidoglycan/LPS O-acetylase OafA/YrhL